MALAAQNTTSIKLGTLVAIPSNRLAPVTAAAAASINRIAPGRVIVGLGTGYTGRNTMGLPVCDIDAARAGKTSGTQQLTRRVYGNRAGSYLDGSATPGAC